MPSATSTMNPRAPKRVGSSTTTATTAIARPATSLITQILQRPAASRDPIPQMVFAR